MIGNNRYDDIAGAARVGMDGFYIHSALSPETDPETSVPADYCMMKMNLRLLQKRLLE